MVKIIMIVLGVILIDGIIALGILYGQGTNKVAQAESEMVTLESEISTYEDNINTLESQLTTTQAAASDLEARLVDSQDTISDLETQLEDSQATALALESQFDVLQSKVSDLETQQAISQMEISSLETDLDSARASIETQLVLNQNLAVELGMVTDPRHFRNLSELVDWLAQDDTDSEFPDKYGLEKCYILQVRALRDGFILPAWFADPDEDRVIDYVGNIAYIDDRIYRISAGNDNVLLWELADPVPLHPLPLN